MDSAHPSIPSRNEDFYLDDIVFLVEGQLFKTYAYYFMQHSPMLKSRIEEARALSGVETLLGVNDEHPLSLDDVTAFEFERFLSTVYPLDPIRDPVKRLFTDWENIPKLVRKLGMNTVREQCIETLKPILSKLTSIEKLTVGRQFSVESWFCSAVSELVTRDAMLTADEAQQLRLGTAFCISRLREDWRRLKENDVTDILEDVLKKLRYNHKHYYHSSSGIPNMPSISSEKFEQLDLAIRQCFKSELADMGSGEYENRQPQLFLQCLDGDQLHSKNVVTALETDALYKLSKSPMKHRIHYPEAIVLQVDNQLFKVHRNYFLKHSPVFRDMLRFKADSDKECLEGQTDDHPLRLDGITKNSFELFLSIIVPKDFLVNVNLSFDEWQAVLELSTMWRMRSLREHCIKHMSPLPNSVSHIDKILMARKYMAEEWLVEGYGDLIVTPDSLSDAGVEQLGAASSIQLLLLKVKWLENSDRTDTSIPQAVRSAFQSEIQRLREYDTDSEE